MKRRKYYDRAHPNLAIGAASKYKCWLPNEVGKGGGGWGDQQQLLGVEEELPSTVQCSALRSRRS